MAVTAFGLQLLAVLPPVSPTSHSKLKQAHNITRMCIQQHRVQVRTMNKLMAMSLVIDHPMSGMALLQQQTL